MPLRVLLISDVPVELRSAGSTLLYRLFQDYPQDSLWVVQSSLPDKERCLRDVRYSVQVSRVAKRLQRTRFHAVGSQLEFMDALVSRREIDNIIRNFRPDAIVSVTFRFAWIKAYKASKRHGIPLHLILHDDIVTGEDHGSVLRPLINRVLARVYRHASTRACISPNMELHYRNMFGVPGTLMYPTYAPDQEFGDTVHVSHMNEGLTFCYAGSLYTSDFLPMLNRLAGELNKRKSRLVIFADVGQADIAKYPHLKGGNVELMGMVHPNELKRFMENEVDVNLLLNSFEHEEAFRYNFSSKLVDYSLAGKPVFIWGCKTSGAISWAESIGYPCLTSQGGNDLSAYTELFFNEQKRTELGMAISLKGRETFNYKTNADAFFKSLGRAKQLSE